jgi:hypothetical protein
MITNYLHLDSTSRVGRILTIPLSGEIRGTVNGLLGARADANLDTSLFLQRDNVRPSPIAFAPAGRRRFFLNRLHRVPGEPCRPSPASAYGAGDSENIREGFAVVARIHLDFQTAHPQPDAGIGCHLVSDLQCHPLRGLVHLFYSSRPVVQFRSPIVQAIGNRMSNPDQMCEQ